MGNSIAIRWFGAIVGTKQRSIVSAGVLAIFASIALWGYGLIRMKAVPSAMAVLAICSAMLVIIGHQMFLWWKGKQVEAFKNFFEFEPPTSPAEVILSQGVVEQRLQQLAERFRAACKQEEDFLDGKDPLSCNIKTPEQFEAAKARHAELRIEISDAKVSFWRAHELAAGHRYQVRRSFKQYLNLR